MASSVFPRDRDLRESVPGWVKVGGTLNVILEFFGTAVNLFCLQAELVELAGSLDRLDVEMLRRK